ncbi:integrase family protein [Calothrix sp. NIES-4101]|nr:integrase family protein [Calothrix sp. NIES-4101]
MKKAIVRLSPDQKLIDMWLHGRPLSTQSEYRRDIKCFLEFTEKPLPEQKLEDLQRYAVMLQTKNLKERTIKRKINTIKSLFSFAAKLQYIRFNVAAALRLPKTEYTIAPRILPQREILKLINAAQSPRDTAILKLLYATGMRVSELCGLNWEDFIERDDGQIQVSILGKGGKRRIVLVPDSAWVAVESLGRGEGAVFLSSKAKRCDRTTIHRIIKAAAVKSGINPKISAHWLRHANASHALSRGASIALVKETLGHSSIAITDVYVHANPNDSTGNYLGI